MTTDNPETKVEKVQASSLEGEGLKGHGGKLLTERPDDGKGAKTTGKFDNPTMADLLALNSKDWDAYAVQQTEKREREARAFPNQAEQEPAALRKSPAEFAAMRKELDAKELAKLTEPDLKVVGDFAKALSGPNPTDKALAVLKQAYDQNYPADRIEGINTALRLELQRRGLDKDWYFGFSMGPTGALANIQDKRVNLAKGGGTEYQSYETIIGKFD